MPPSVRVSEIGLYLRCPRLVYFEFMGKSPSGISGSSGPSIENLVLRSLMLSITQKEDLPDPMDLENHLRESLLGIERELPLVYGLDSDRVSSACRALEGGLSGMARSLADQLDLLLPCELELDLRSDALGLTGRLDRLACGCVPSIIRGGSAPEQGVWRRDRLVLAGYSLLLAEKMSESGSRSKSKSRSGCAGGLCDLGLVEYPRQGLVRSVQIHSVDRARVLRLRDRIRQIKEGRLPDRPEDANCLACHARDLCESRHSLASKFF